MQMKSQVTKVVATVGLLFGVVAIAAGPAGASSRHDNSHSALYVSNHSSTTWAHDRHHGGCEDAAFTSIGAAVAAANSYDTVIVCPGTYAEDVQVNKPLQLVGRHATIDATGLANGIVITSSYVGVSGFTVTGALGEGILAQPAGAAALPVLTSASQALQPISRVGIWNNVVNANNTGGNPVTHQCTAIGLYPGDCGGGIHLNTVSDSFVTQNVVTNNDDGILLTDDDGPNFGNYIADNYVAHNIYECGIVLPSHNSFAVSVVENPDHTTFTTGALTPASGGVFDNWVYHNKVIDNGTVVVPPFGGSGSGVGIFAPAPGSASYDNTVKKNFIVGSGQAGFTIHAHYTGGEYVSGNRIVENYIGTNNTGGDGLDGPSTNPDFSTTGILVFSAVHVDIVIAHNHIWGNKLGIWLSADVNAAGLRSNDIDGSTTPIYTSLAPVAFTGPAISNTAPTATVGVLINPNGLATTYFVQYGTTMSYSSATTSASAGSGFSPEALPVTITGPLTTGVTYHYRVVAKNSAGTTYGGDATLTES